MTSRAYQEAAELAAEKLLQAMNDARRAYIESRPDLVELVEGYIAGTVRWDRRRWGPAPGEDGCLVARDVLKSAGWEDW